VPNAGSVLSSGKWKFPQSDRSDAFGEALKLRRQIAQALLDRGRRSLAGQTPSLGRSAAIMVRRHMLGR
jgi:hypothetical protein